MIQRENEGEEEKTIELPYDEHDVNNHPSRFMELYSVDNTMEERTNKLENTMMHTSDYY